MLPPWIQEADMSLMAQEFVDFVAFLSLTRHLAPETIMCRLSALRWWHGSGPTGPGLPAIKHPAIVAAIRGVAATAAPPKHRPPIFLHAIAGGLERAQSKGPLEQMVARGIAIAYFFLLRASEIWAYDNGVVHSDFCLLARDVTFVAGSNLVPLSEALAGRATGVRVHLRGSKTDQRRVGTMLFRCSTGGGPLDPVRLVAEQLACLPPCGPDSEVPLMAFARGDMFRTITRAEVVAEVRAMALAAGQCVEGLGTHAMRVGAATSLAHAGASQRLIMAAGRWRSLAVMVYVRDNLADMERISWALSPRWDVAAALVI
jgi:hypothetical protein